MQSTSPALMLLLMEPTPDLRALLDGRDIGGLTDMISNGLRIGYFDIILGKGTIN